MNKPTILSLIHSTTLTLVLASAGCVAKPNANVTRVQNELSVLKSDPAVISNATIQLQDAERAVLRSEDTWSKTQDPDEAEHLSYLASKRIEIARVKTNQQLAESEAIRLSHARETASINAQTISLRESEARASLADANALRTVALIQDRQSQINELKGQLIELKARDGTRGLTLTLGDVMFESNRAEFKSGAARKLLELITFVRNHPQEYVTIEGHTDNTGPTSSNIDLSLRRAEAVRQLFIDNRINSDRISTRGLGEQFPLASNNTAAGRLQNRRVEIIVSNSSNNSEVH